MTCNNINNMENKNIKRFTRIKKLGFTLMIIGATILVVTVIVASLRTDILCGIAVSGLFLTILGIVLATIYSNQEE